MATDAGRTGRRAAPRAPDPRRSDVGSGSASAVRARRHGRPGDRRPNAARIVGEVRRAPRRRRARRPAADSRTEASRVSEAASDAPVVRRAVSWAATTMTDAPTDALVPGRSRGRLCRLESRICGSTGSARVHPTARTPVGLFDGADLIGARSSAAIAFLVYLAHALAWRPRRRRRRAPVCPADPRADPPDRLSAPGAAARRLELTCRSAASPTA